MTDNNLDLPAILAAHGKWQRDEPGGKRASLRGADMDGADLTGANLRGADLRGADMRGADLRGADIRGADMRGADLRGADLSDADMRGADLTGADLSDADLRGAEGADLVIARTRILPECEIIGWKAALAANHERVIVKLLIPADAARSHAFGRKCRASKAKVLEIIGATEATSQHDRSFVYRVGETVEPCEPFDPDWQNECASGIHFYITRIEAENH